MYRRFDREEMRGKSLQRLNSVFSQRRQTLNETGIVFITQYFIISPTQFISTGFQFFRSSCLEVLTHRFLTCGNQQEQQKEHPCCSTPEPCSTRGVRRFQQEAQKSSLALKISLPTSALSVSLTVQLSAYRLHRIYKYAEVGAVS